MAVRLDMTKARELLRDARSAAPAGVALELTIEESQSELTRFANNAIHQHVGESTVALSVRAQFDRRTARASTHRLDAAGVHDVVDRAVRLTRSQAEDLELLPVAAPAPAGQPDAISRYDEATAAITPAQRAEAVAAMVAVARERQLTAAGICATRQSRLAILNTNGIEAFHASTGAEYSVTMMAANSSGWAKAGGPAWQGLSPATGARAAAEKACATADAIEVPAAPMTVILEPAAVLDLLGFLMWDFGALSVLDQRSFLSNRVGSKLFGDNVNIVDDVRHPLQTGAPFDGEGVSRQAVTLVENGWVRNLVYARQTAARANARPTGHGFPLPNEYGEGPVNVVFAGGATPVEEMIASTARGILVTRLWYIREVDPYQKILTGMTRDGTFLIEDGRLRHGVRNFRFNQNMIALLNQIEALSPAVRASGEESFDMVVPALKVRDFNFTEVTRF
ncbi:MAG TPA: metallopeptidase TldD-related protein [Terriglobales bacterium]|nr:metallopeptidase TldD-related protein [Terriglobales bacterium]